MKILEVKSLVFPEVKVIKFARFSDNRGYFTETFRRSQFLKEALPGFKIYQINESFSKKGVIRGLHFQWNPYMGKLVRVISGHIIDLFLDIRKGSPNFGKIAGYELEGNSRESSNEWLWIPVGFAHGFLAQEESTIEYLCTEEYNPACEAGISPLASDINWSLCDKKIKLKFDQFVKKGVIISEKDKNGLSLKEWGSDQRSNYFIYKSKSI